MKRTPRDGFRLFMRCTPLSVIMLAFLAAAVVGPPTRAQGMTGADNARPTTGAGVLFLNEDLIYEVSWMGVPLGSIRTIVTRRLGEGEKAIVTAVAHMNSYSGIPFVDLHETDESTMDHDGISLSFHSREKSDEKWKITDYAFDQQKHRLIARESIADSETGSGSVLKKTDTVSIAQNCVDGLSLLYFARINARTTKRSAVPTFLKGKQGTTMINFYRKETSADIDAVDYPVDVVELDGDAQFSGILGMTGAFTGWFSNDEAQIPIKGKVKILLGSITVELKQWYRKGWNPPRYHSK